MIGPILLPLVMGIAGWFGGGAAGAVVGVLMGLLVDAAIVLSAAMWMRRIGSLLEPEDAWENAPRPPGFTRLVEWVYERSGSTPDRS